MIKERDRVDPSTCVSPVQRLPQDSQRQPERNHADGDAHSGERLADGPEKDPGERKGVARKRERQHDHGDAGECAPQPSVPQGRRMGVRNMREAESRRGEHRGKGDQTEDRPGPWVGRNAHVPPVAQTQIDELEDVPEDDAGSTCRKPVRGPAQGRRSPSGKAVEGDEDAYPGERKPQQVDARAVPRREKGGGDESGATEELDHRGTLHEARAPGPLRRTRRSAIAARTRRASRAPQPTWGCCC